MQREEIGGDNAERDDASYSRSRTSRILQERMERRHRRASLGRLIFYIVALIIIILLMLSLRRSVI